MKIPLNINKMIFDRNCGLDDKVESEWDDGHSSIVEEEKKRKTFNNNV